MPLAQIVGAADAIQHAILTWEEADGGLYRLITADYAHFRDGRVGLTPRGRALFAALDAKTVLGRQDQLQAALGAPEWSNQPPTATREIGQHSIISAAEFESAVKEYVGHPARTMRGT